jgi:tripartite-type tricarboxylate transporter receptor subunit TctC
MRSPFRSGLIALIAGICVASTANAQDYPARQVTIIAPIGAGGPLDLTARLLASKLADALGKPFIVENRPGGGTIVGAMAVVKADADGHTLLIAPNSTVTTNVTVFKKLPYDPEKDLIPIALLARVPFVLVAGPSANVKTVPELIAAAKKDPGKMSFGSTGLGTTPHLAGEIMKSMAAIQITHVAYRSAAAAVSDVVAGHLQMTFADPANAKPMIEATKVTALGVSSSQRVSMLPNVATLAESGLPGFEATAWNMLLAPANTPKDVVEKLHNAVKAAMAQPDVQGRMVAMGLIAPPSPSTDELKKFLATEIVRWGNAVKQAGIAGSE